ncbi:MAG: DUF2946 family protein [Methylocella sp.]
MRRRFKAAIPVFLLALLVQVFATGWGGLAMQAGAVASTAHCSAMAGGAAGEQQTPPGQPHHNHQCCVFCHLPAAVDPAPMAAAFAVPAPVARDVAWTFDPAPAPSAPARKHARARAPPSLV